MYLSELWLSHKGTRFSGGCSRVLQDKGGKVVGCECKSEKKNKRKKEMPI